MRPPKLFFKELVNFLVFDIFGCVLREGWTSFGGDGLDYILQQPDTCKVGGKKHAEAGVKGFGSFDLSARADKRTPSNRKHEIHVSLLITASVRPKSANVL